MKNPKVSVIMPVFNSMKYLHQAIRSILDQSFKDFELIIINDNSTDESLDVIRSFSDQRIILINNEKRGTITESRNQGIAMSRGEFIAPLDSDDIAHKDRLKLEIEFLESHPDVGLVGSHVILINKDGEPTGVKWKEKIPDEKIPIRLIFSNCFSQSSLLIRKRAIPEGGYIEGTSEDYALWVRMMKNWKAHIMPKALLSYRTHGENTSTTKSALLHQAVNEILRSQLERIGIEASDEELKLHRMNYRFSGSDHETKSFINKREHWLLKLREANKECGPYDAEVFDEVIAERFLTTLDANSRLGFYNLRIFQQSLILKKLNWSENCLKILKFVIKCLIRKK